METKVYNQKGKSVGAYELPARIFEVPANSDTIHRALVVQTSNQRQPVAHTKTRGEVRGGGIKPWRQKGTGRARHGSIRSPIWVGGGVTFGPRSERSYKIKINKKEKQKALFMVLSSKVRDAEIALVEDLNLKEPKTKTMSEILKAVFSGAFNAERLKKTLIVVSKNDNNAELSARNLPVAKVVKADSLNIYDLLSRKYLIMSQEAAAMIEQTYKKI